MSRIYNAMTMRKFEKARQAMIDSQIHPLGVVSDNILEAFQTVPREEFVPPEKQGIAYCDEDIEIGGGRYLMEPSVLARLLEHANLTQDHVVLTIGSGAGYTAAILSQLVSTVVAVENEALFVQQAQSIWDKHGYCNIAGVSGPLERGAPDSAPYDYIFFNGAVSDVPQNIKDQLKVEGSLFVLIKKAGQTIAKATEIKHISQDIFSEHTLFDTGTPYLQGFEPKKEFVF
jgi:protein-L-isoaspartate(D-aspartate) O-methyltransferase